MRRAHKCHCQDLQKEKFKTKKKSHRNLNFKKMLTNVKPKCDCNAILCEFFVRWKSRKIHFEFIHADIHRPMDLISFAQCGVRQVATLLLVSRHRHWFRWSGTMEKYRLLMRERFAHLHKNVAFGNVDSTLNKYWYVFIRFFTHFDLFWPDFSSSSLVRQQCSAVLSH